MTIGHTFRIQLRNTMQRPAVDEETEVERGDSRCFPRPQAGLANSRPVRVHQSPEQESLFSFVDMPSIAQLDYRRPYSVILWLNYNSSSDPVESGRDDWVQLPLYPRTVYLNNTKATYMISPVVIRVIFLISVMYSPASTAIDWYMRQQLFMP